MIQLIDIHTHARLELKQSVFSLKNIVLPNQEVPLKGTYSAGWHPWFIENYSFTEIAEKLNDTCKRTQIIAIGECGLDRAIQTPINIQQKVFELHLNLAQQLGKPIILHTVRSYSDVLQILKSGNYQLPVIFHDYRGNAQQTHELLKFNSYFSFGESIIKEHNSSEKLKAVPSNRLLLETDESELSIEKIYLSAASVLGWSFERLSEQIYSNFITIFGDGLVE